MARRGSYAKGIARREQILDRALEAIGKHGYRNVALKNIAEKVGVTPAALLHYFGTKEELLTAVLRKRDENDSIGTITDPAEMKDAFVRVVRHNAEVPGLVELFSQLSVDAADPQHPAHEYFLARNTLLRERTAAAFEAQAQKVPSLPPEMLARVIQAVSDGLQLQWMIEPDLDMADIIDRLFTALQRPA